MSATISIVIPTYDRTAKLARALQSCREQSQPPTEVLVVDNGRNPQTPGVVKAAQAEAKDYPVHYIQSELFNLRKALSLGIEKASSEWTILLDDDDYLVPYRLADDYRIIQDLSSDVIVLVHDFARINYQNDLVWLHTMAHKELGLLQALTRDHFPPPPAATWRSAPLKAHHSFDLPEGWMTDFELYASLLPHGSIQKTGAVGYVMDDTRTADRLTSSVDKYMSMVDLHRERFKETTSQAGIDPETVNERLAQQKAFFAAKNQGLSVLLAKESLCRRHPKETFKGLLSPLRALASRYLSSWMPEMRGSKSHSLAGIEKTHRQLHRLITESRISDTN